MAKVMTKTLFLALISLISICTIARFYFLPASAQINDIKGKLKGNEEKSAKQIGFSRNPSTNRSYEHFDSFVQNYIDFHNSAIKDGRLRDSFRYVIYTCSEKELCGGVGDRVLSMVKAFYFAMITRRVLLIDSKFPTDLKKYLNPNFVQWDAEFNAPEFYYDDMYVYREINMRTGAHGYDLGKCNGRRRKTVTDLLEEDLMQDILHHYGYFNYPVSRAIHQAFWALFKFDDSVLSRAEEMKHSAGLALPHFGDVSDNHIEESSNSEGMVPYIGLHSRQNDNVVKGVPVDEMYTMERKTDSTELVTCYQTFLKVYPDKYQAAYLASNDSDMKNSIQAKDPTILFANDVDIFHLDLSSRFGKPETDTSDIQVDIHQGVTDAWAEVAVLVDSDCLIMSKSMFSFLAYYIRDETMCGVFIPDCNENTVTQKVNKYPTDPLYIIYHWEHH